MAIFQLSVLWQLAQSVPNRPWCGSRNAWQLAQQIDACPHLHFGGLQAYYGKAQHIRDFTERTAAIDAAHDQVRACVADLEAVTVKTAGAAESLNVAVAGALLLFAAGRNQGGGDA